jgi:hypothetical protein
VFTISAILKLHEQLHRRGRQLRIPGVRGRGVRCFPLPGFGQTDGRFPPPDRTDCPQE